MKKKIITIVAFVSFIFAVSCGSGITGLEGFAAPVSIDASSAGIEFALLPKDDSPLRKAIDFLKISEAIAAITNYDVPNLHWAPDCPICQVKPECAALDAANSSSTFIVPSAISGGDLAVGQKYMVAIVSEGQSGYQPGKEDCFYTNQAITDNWQFSVSNCDSEVSITNGPNDGEAIIEVLAAGGTCTLSATGRDANGSISPDSNALVFDTVAASNLPPITAIKINGEAVDYLQPVKLDSFASTTTFSVESSASLNTELTDWRASNGIFGNTGSNTFNWSAYEGAERVALLVTIKSSNSVLNQVKFIAVE